MQLFLEVARQNYEGNLEEVRTDLCYRLEDKPMYAKLGNRLKRDIRLLDKMIRIN